MILVLMAAALAGLIVLVLVVLLGGERPGQAGASGRSAADGPPGRTPHLPRGLADPSGLHGPPPPEAPAEEIAQSLLALAARLRAVDCGSRSARLLVAAEDDALDVRHEALWFVRALCAAETEAGTRNWVILVDSSQGSAALSSLLHIPRSPGLSELLQGKAGFTDVVRRDPFSTCHVIASGKPRAVGGGWGSPAMLDRVLRALDETYDHVVLFGAMSEALHLAGSVGRRFDAGVVIGDSPTPQAGPASARLDSFGFPVSRHSRAARRSIA